MYPIETLKTATWLNPPSHWQLNESCLTLKTGAETDFWQKTLYGFRRDSGHAFLVPVIGDFTAYLTFTGDYEVLYDQAGLMLRQDASLWLKTGLELSDDVQNMSVVVTRDTSDWSTVALPMPSESQRLRLTRLGSAVVIQFRNEANRWQLLRVTDFPAVDRLLVGPMACSPQSAGFEATFSEFSIGPAVTEALHDKSPAS